MVTSMLEKAIEIEGLLRIIRDGNPLPETYILLNIKTAELAEQAISLEERSATSEADAASADFQLAIAKKESAPEVAVTNDIHNITEKPTESEPTDEKTPEIGQDPATFTAEEEKHTDTSHNDFDMQTEMEMPIANVDFVMATAEAAPQLPPVVFTEENPAAIEKTPEAPLAMLTPSSENYPDLDDLELSEEDDIILSFDDTSDFTLSATSTPAAAAEPILISAPAADIPTQETPEVEMPEVKYQEKEQKAEETEAEETEAEEPHTFVEDKAVEETAHASTSAAPAAKRSVKLKSFFSLNDRFLYSRELFDGNSKMFDSTLEFIEGIDDYSIIEDYFYSELEWDPEDRNVAAFMEILRPHFRE